MALGSSFTEEDPSAVLDDLESKLEVPGNLRFDADARSAAYSGQTPAISPLVNWWRGAAHG